MTTFEVKISPPRRAKATSEEEEEIPILLLAPFQKPPTITFQDVELGSIVEQQLLISNRGSHRPTNVQVKFTKLPSPEHNFVFSETELSLDPNENAAVIIRWAPRKLGSWRETVQVNYSSNTRMDLPVYVLFNSIPRIKKRNTKPLRHQNSMDPVYHVPKKSGKFISPKNRMSSLNRQHNRKTTPNKENKAPNSGNRNGKKLTQMSGSPLNKLTIQTPASVNIQSPTRVAASPRSRSRRSRSTDGSPSSCVSHLKSRRSKSSSRDFFDQLSAVTFSPLNLDRSPFESRQKTSSSNKLCYLSSNQLSRKTFLTSEMESLLDDDNLEDLFLPLNGKPLPPCDVPPSPLRRTTYDVDFEVSSFVKGEEFRPLNDDQLPPCTVPASPWRRTTYVTSTDVNHWEEDGASTKKFSSCRLFSCTVSDNLPTIQDFETKLRRCSNETYIKSPSSASVADMSDVVSPVHQPLIRNDERNYQTPSIVGMSDGNESAQNVIEAGLWFDPFNQSSSQLSDIVPVAYSTRSRSQTPASGKKTLKTRPSVARRALSMPRTKALPDDDSQLMKPPVGRPPKGGGRMQSGNNSLSTISAKRAQRAMRTLSTRLVTSTPVITVSTPVKDHHDPNDFLYQLANPDPFCASTTTDPFVMSQVYHSDEWLDRQERNFVKWLNDLLTPSDDLDSNAEPPKVDLVTLWKKSYLKTAPTLAPSIEVVSLRVVTHARLDAVRKAAARLYRTPRTARVLAKVVGHVDRGLIAIRKDRQIHLDVGLKAEVMGLLLCYNPLWLRIGLETVFGAQLRLHSNSDVEGLGAFVATRLLDDPYTAKKFSHPSVPLVRLPGYEEAIKKFILKNFLALVFFLDQAKGQRLIGHDPCLFCKNAKYTESNAILLSFARELVSGKLITKQLGTLGYTVSHKQTYLNEFNFAVAHLGSDLRDGIRLTRVMEIILRDNSLQAKLRAPPISLLQKIHNVGVALKSLEQAGYVVEGDITAKDITNGHREKTLSLLWQIVYKFQAPRFRAAAHTIQNWWRSLPVCIHRRIIQRKLRLQHTAATKIKALWKGHLARKKYLVIKKNAEEIAVKHRAANTIQAWYRAHYRIKLDAKRNRAATTIQRVFSDYMIRKQLKHKAATLIQRTYRAHLASQQTMFKLGSAIKIQTAFRGYLVRKRLRLEIVSATTIQAAFRGYLQRRRLRLENISAQRIQRCYRSYLVKKQLKIDMENECATRIQALYRGYRVRRQAQLNNAAVAIQALVRGFLCRKVLVRQRRLEAATRIQNWFRRQRAVRRLDLLVIAVEREIMNKRQERLTLRATVIIQKYTRGHIAREYVSHLRREAKEAEERVAATKIQAAFHGYLVRKRLRVECMSATTIQAAFRGYLQRRRLTLENISAQRIQRCYRSYLVKKQLKIDLENECATRIQALYRGYRVRQRQAQLNSAAVTIQAVVRGFLCRKGLERESRLEAAMQIQNWFRRQRAVQRLDLLVIAVEREIMNKRQARLTLRATIIIQKYIRRHIAREYVSRLRREAYEAEQRQAATKIQAVFRGYLIRRRLRVECTSATTIQAAFRGYLQRRRLRLENISAQRIQRCYRCYLVKKQLKIDLENECATRIQALYRGYRVRQRQAQLNSAAVTIQALVRGFLCRKRLERESRLEAATRIQNWFRRQRAVQHLDLLVIAVEREIMNKRQAKLTLRATIIIQKYMRGHIAREYVSRLRREAKEAEQRQAATKIQAVFHGYLVRKRLRVECMSATTIQATFRGYLQRRRLRLENISAQRIQRCYRSYLVKKQLKIDLENECATRIQALYRGYRVRQRQAQLNNAAVTIQALVRGFLCRKRLERESRLEAATRIQNWFRRQRAVQHLDLLVIAVEREIMNKRQARLTLRATVIIQKYMRGYIAREYVSRLRREAKEAEQRMAATKIQAVFHGYLVRKRLRVECMSATTIQAAFRGYVQRRRLRLENISAQRIQRCYRSYLVKKQLKIDLENECATRIQALYRGYRVRQRQAQLNSAAVTIQALVRGFLCRKRLERESRLEAATRIQNWFRRQRAVQHLDLLVIAVEREIMNKRQARLTLRATVIIQKYMRGHIAREYVSRLRREAKEAEQRIAATKIQAAFHGYLVRKRLRVECMSATTIQAAFRGYLQRRTLSLENISAQRIQRCYRCYLIKKQLKIDLENECATRIQALYRGYCARQRHARLNNAAVAIQALVRGFLCRKRLERQHQLEAATRIQNWFRRQRARQRLVLLVIAIRREVLQMRQAKLTTEELCLQATITLQKYGRGFLARTRVSNLRRQRAAKEAERIVCATKIQAYWRGFHSRKTSQCRKAVAIRERLIEVKNGKTLLLRYLETSKMLNATVSMCHLLAALTTLDTVTRLSPALCEKFSEDGHIDVLYGYLEELNRSVPHMDCIALATQIFMNLVRHPPTLEAVYQDGGGVAVLLRLMTTFGGKPSPIFNNCCTLVWLFARDPDRAKALTADLDNQKQLLKLHADEERRWHLSMRMGKHKESSNHILPAVQPHWALNRERRPRTFEDQYHAICTLFKILKLKVQTKKT